MGRPFKKPEDKCKKKGVYLQDDLLLMLNEVSEQTRVAPAVLMRKYIKACVEREHKFIFQEDRRKESARI